MLRVVNEIPTPNGVALSTRFGFFHRGFINDFFIAPPLLVVVLRTIAVCLHGQLGVEHTATLHPVDNPS